MLFGALIGATDPVSVIATFKEAGSDGRPRLLIGAESLLNDGTAAVAFVAVLGALAGDQIGLLSLSEALVLSIAGGVLVGAVARSLWRSRCLSLPDLGDRNTITTVTFAVVAFSVLVQGLTIAPLLQRLGQLPPR
ncbi:MAG: cation:proton antiporter [Gammaproteobacteria bacterium]|nr:cation:proton antiporter [Gammaproteobacteria bacterium]